MFDEGEEAFDEGCVCDNCGQSYDPDDEWAETYHVDAFCTLGSDRS